MGILWQPLPKKPRRRYKRARKLRVVKRRWDALLARMTERLEQVRATEKLSRRRFAAKIGVPPPSYHRQVSARRPGIEAIYGAALALGINPRWLLDGHGEQKIRVQDWWDQDQPKENNEQTPKPVA